jgi:hypothetical protein
LRGMLFSNISGALSEAGSAATADSARPIQELSEKFRDAAAAISANIAAEQAKGPAADQARIAAMQAQEKEYDNKSKTLSQRAADTQNKPNAGGVMSSAMQGFAQGGLWGAIINIIGSIVGKLKGFWKCLQEVQPIVDLVVAVLGKVFDALAWFTHITMGWLRTVYNWIVRVINAALGWAGVHLKKWKEDVLPETPVVEDATRAIADLSDSAKDASEELLNAAAGWKVNLARFNATTGTMPAINVDNGRNSGNTTTNQPPVTINGDIVVQAQDPAELAMQIQRINEHQQFIMTGSTVPRSPTSAR